MNHLNITAPVNSTGYGLTSLNILTSLDEMGCEPAWWPIGPVEAPAEYHDSLRSSKRRTETYDASAASLRIFHQFDLAQHVGKGIHAALPIFELDRFRPVELHHLHNQDVIIANSKWAGNVLIQNGIPATKIRYAPLGVDVSIFGPAGDHSHQATIFLNVGKWEIRKGHDLLLRAFEAAFNSDDNVELWLVCHNPVVPPHMPNYNEQWVSYYKSSRLAGKIKLLPRQQTQRDIAAIMRQADCGVFPSRAEGWGLESAEMLRMGKRIIATEYAGHTGYLTRENSLLISVDTLEEAHDDVWFFANHPDWQGNPGRWASLGKDQFDQLVEYMRATHREKKEKGFLPLNEAGIKTMEPLTWTNTAKLILDSLT